MKNEKWNDSLIWPFTTPHHVNEVRVDKQYIGHFYAFYIVVSINTISISPGFLQNFKNVTIICFFYSAEWMCKIEKNGQFLCFILLGLK